MYLKSIEVYGFKSFANRINFKFDKGLKNFEEVRSLSPEKSELV